MSWKRFGLLPLLVGTVGLQTAPAPAQSYPSRPVRVMVGFAPGGPNDIIARAYGARLAETFGQAFVVENRAGAGGNLAAEAVARAAPDGQTLMLGSTGTNSVNPGLYAKLPFDLVRDLDMVSLVATGNSALAVHPSVPATSVKELVALAKAQPGKLTYASSGNGPRCTSRPSSSSRWRAWTSCTCPTKARRLR